MTATRPRPDGASRMAPDSYYLSTAAELEDACQHLIRLNAPSLPLWRAAADRRLAIITVHSPDATWPSATLERLIGRPVGVVICDDPDIGDGTAFGPDPWLCAKRLKYWTRTCMAHGAGSEPDHYREAVRAAEMFSRMALIETSSIMAPVWARFMACPRTLMILPTNGGPHPLPLEQRVRQ